MAKVAFEAPVEDSVPKVNDEVAVGEDLRFQERWWRFEHIVWIVFGFILLGDVLGLFGRGWLAKAERQTADGAIQLRYERVERASTPSIMTVKFGPSAIQDGKVRVYVSDTVVKELGAQRIVPQPETSTVGDGGITYTFPTTQSPATVQIEMQPSFPGLHRFALGIAGHEPVNASVFVMP